VPSSADLVSNVHEARQAWRDALEMLNFVDTEFVDYAVFHLNASERLFVALLQEARRKGVTAWVDEQLRPPVTIETVEHGPSVTEYEVGACEPMRAPPSKEYD
jgi:nucleoid-associated protein YejK